MVTDRADAYIATMLKIQRIKQEFGHSLGEKLDEIIAGIDIIAGMTPVASPEPSADHPTPVAENTRDDSALLELVAETLLTAGQSMTIADIRRALTEHDPDAVLGLHNLHVAARDPNSTIRSVGRGRWASAD